MTLQAYSLYALVVLIWGSTWAAIPYQLNGAAEEVSVAIRFALASALLFAYAVLTRRRMRIAMSQYPMVIVMGVLMFSANYLFTYYSINYVTSALVAVSFSLLVAVNAVLERLFFGRRLGLRLLIASALGIVGVALMFWPEVETLDVTDTAFFGTMLALIAVVFASLGNMAAIVNTNRHLPIVTVNAHGMAWGALASVTIAASTGRDFTVTWDASYTWSMLYLSLFGSAVAFGGYISLLRMIGAARAAYSSVLFPLVALLISTFVEDYQWSPPAVFGMLFVVAGNWLALTRINKEQR